MVKKTVISTGATQNVPATIVGIKDLPINGGIKISESGRARFIKIVEEEFSLNAHRYAIEEEENKKKILESYRKEAGYDKLYKKFEEASQKERSENNRVNKLLRNAEDACIKAKNDAQELLEKTKKDVQTEYNKKSIELSAGTQEAKEGIYKLGLNTDGELYHTRYGMYDKLSPEIKNRIIKLSNTIETIANSGPRNLKNKIITRILLAQTQGEVMVIMHDLLGNDLLPGMTKDELKTE